MLKKILKITGIILIVIAASLFAIPYFFKDQIKAKIADAINKNVDAKVSFADADLSLFKNFPNANVTLDKLVIINKAPFEGDTLISLGELNLKMSIKELFKGKNEAMNIDGITSKNGLINIIFNKDGIGNYDIALKDDKSKDDGKSSPLSFKIKNYKIEIFKFKYFDESSKIKMIIDSLNHEGTGDFAAQKLDLVTTKFRSDNGKYNYVYKLFDFLQLISKWSTPFCLGGFMMIRSETFKTLGGFDEEIKVAEDYHFSKQIKPKKFGRINNVVFTPPRRFENKGLLYMIKLFLGSFFNHKNKSYFTDDKNYW